MFSLGIDLGSSSVKAALVNLETGKLVHSEQFPKQEMKISAPEQGWAEQDPELWWHYVKKCIQEIRNDFASELSATKYIGIAYQMHGLVAVNKEKEVVRPSIIWCDGRAVEIGRKAKKNLGDSYCLGELLNSPGNFTASKLRWVRENEPELYATIHKFMLPGDYIAMKLTGIINSTITGLSEGIFWNFKKDALTSKLLKYYDIDEALVPEVLPSFSNHGTVSAEIADELGLPLDAIITYKAGDQPNNAFSLNVMEPGEVAATAGTSGVVYAVTDELFVDPSQKVNSFAHVNHQIDNKRIGVLLCINGVGIANSFIKRLTKINSYDEMNELASTVEAGSQGLNIFPFGNGAERMLQNKNIGASIHQLQYNLHTDAHICRAVLEGIAYAFAYGLESLKENGLAIDKIKAGYANMFLSPVFAQILSDITLLDIELYNTDGSVGAARGAALGANYKTKEEIFENLKVIKKITPNKESHSTYTKLFGDWKERMEEEIKQQNINK